MTGDDMKDEGTVLTLDKPRYFKVSWNTMRALQKQYGTVETAMEKIASSDFDAILYLLWAAQADDEPISMDELGDLITPELFGEAFSTAFELSGTQPKKYRLLGKRPKNAKRPHR